MFEILDEEMKLRNFSSQTKEVYLYYNSLFLKFIRKSPREVSASDIRAYLLHLIERRYSTSSVNLAHSALNFYYGKVLRKAVKSVAFQKREDKVKYHLSQEEIRHLQMALSNPKHKLMLGLAYASGVRVGELVKIKVEQIDWERKMLLVKEGKGRKDRYTILSEPIIQDIKEYLHLRSLKGVESPYLFESRAGHITTRAFEEIVKQAAKRAKLERKVHPHLLRHSFATHLLESGARESHIQQLLGHKDIRTTQTYARITNKHLWGVRSPHESL